MKYTKSASPYLTLLFLVLIGLPIINYKAQKTQEIFVKIEIDNPNLKKQQIVQLNKAKAMKNLSVMTLK